MNLARSDTSRVQEASEEEVYVLHASEHALDGHLLDQPIASIKPMIGLADFADNQGRVASL